MCDDNCDGLFGWFQRDQFTYYLTLAYLTADPDDWPAFRRAIQGALVAARCLDLQLRRHGRANGVDHQLGVMRRLDDIRDRHNLARWDPGVRLPWDGGLR